MIPSRRDFLCQGLAAAALAHGAADLGLDADTLFVFFDDQGMEQGKGSCYEGGVRTPMFARWRGRIQRGRRLTLEQRKALIAKYAANKLKHEDRVITNKPDRGFDLEAEQRKHLARVPGTFAEFKTQ